ncbi:histidine kinase [Halorubrum sp. Atlit-8R]|uniref:Histidine kinase n=1 Tax=Halorubrum salinarum TaxID=2739057 RepID=A0A7D4BRR7_9EURY|nr:MULTISPECIES: histidine kinase [Halorubrum]QKG92680.1 histidine kinase [Halorubrum salinarum]RLM68152.1 histidine kinase [Halorubrum sp. Atlit-9R]RLM81382.1 histidine kinase [Halorubrum sp. Atlit-8R]
MATETATATDVPTETGHWQAGVTGGIVGALVFGAMMSILTPGVLEMGIPAMYGIAGPAGALGWVIHVSHGAIIGLGFVAITSLRPALGDSIGTGVGAGAGYGLVVWVALAVVVMPIWLGAVGFAGAPPLPNIGVESLVGHVVYGAVLGGVYSAMAN